MRPETAPFIEPRGDSHPGVHKKIGAAALGVKQGQYLQPGLGVRYDYAFTVTCFTLARTGSKLRPFRHPGSRCVTAAGHTMSPSTPRGMIDVHARWSGEDLRRLGVTEEGYAGPSSARPSVKSQVGTTSSIPPRKPGRRRRPRGNDRLVFDNHTPPLGSSATLYLLRAVRN